MKRYVHRPLSEWAKTKQNKRTYLYLMWIVIKGWPQQRRILIIKWINLFGRYQSVLSLATPVFAQWAREQRAILAGAKVLWGYSNMHFHSPMLIWLEPTLNVQSVRKQRPALSYMTLFPGVISKLPESRLIKFDHSHHEKGRICSYWTKYILWIWIWLPCMQCCHQNYHPWT